MVAFFPEFHEDEILYSVIARYHMRNGRTSITTSIEELFGTKKITATVDFPTNIAALINNFSSVCDLTFKDLVSKHTLFPLYLPFWSAERANAVLDMMFSKQDVNNLHRKAGVNSNLISPWKYLRFCPKCFDEDIIKFGEAFWHRIHQVPGIWVCPTHKEMIFNSTIPIYGVNPQYFQTANKSNCRYYHPEKKITTSCIEKLAQLGQNALELLKTTVCSREYDWYFNTYRSILFDKGFLSRKGYVDQNSLILEFIEYHTPELLSNLGLLPDINRKHNWLSMMVRKSKDYPHPIEHLLFIKFLNYSVIDFFEIKNKQEYCVHEKFDKGPYPCLNAAAEHYKKPIITEVDLHYSRNSNLVATFKCSCGFIYSKIYSDNKSNDIYKYDTINVYGDIWESKFRQLIEDNEIHLREVAKRLNIDLQTVRKHIVRLNLKTKWMTKKISTIEKCNSTEQKFSNTFGRSRKEYRRKWLALIKINKDFSKSKLREIDRHLYYWLDKYDKEWFNQNAPLYKRPSSTNLRVDWVERDIHTRNKVQEVVYKLLNEIQNPVRITDYRIGKELCMTYALRNHLDKMPITKALLENVCESVDQYRIRRIKLAVDKIQSEGVELKPWRILQLTGLYNVKSKIVDSAIRELMIRQTCHQNRCNF